MWWKVFIKKVFIQIHNQTWLRNMFWWHYGYPNLYPSDLVITVLNLFHKTWVWGKTRSFGWHHWWVWYYLPLCEHLELLNSEQDIILPLLACLITLNKMALISPAMILILIYLGWQYENLLMRSSTKTSMWSFGLEVLTATGLCLASTGMAGTCLGIFLSQSMGKLCKFVIL